MRRPSNTVRFAAPALILAATLVAGGCETPPGGPQNIYDVTEGTQTGELIGNTTLQSSLQIENLRSKRLEDGRLMVQFELHNRTSSHLRFAWAIDWFDAAGFKVGDTTRHWDPVNLGGNGFTVIQKTGPTPAANSFKLQVTTPDEVN